MKNLAKNTAPFFCLTLLFLLLVSTVPTVVAQDTIKYSGPILDMHLHAEEAHSPPVALCPPFNDLPLRDPSKTYSWATMLEAYTDPDCTDPVRSPETDEGVMLETIAIMEQRNVFGVLSGSPDRVAEWMSAAPDRFIPGLDFWVKEGPSPDSLRSLYESGALSVLGEVLNQYDGITPNDKRMEPYWALAEELDIPVGIHIGKGAPGEFYLGARDYRAQLYSALTLEEVLVQHPRLRVYIMHAGYPMLDDLLSLMHAHPQVYIDIGVLAWAEPRAGFYRYLKAIIDTGFGKRVMFGSDQRVWPEMINVSIAAIEEAPFLSADKKRDIFYNNAARFLRLSDQEITRHHTLATQAEGER